MLESAGMLIWGTLELSALFAVALAFVGIPLWLLGAGILRIADVMATSRARRRSEVATAAAEAAEATAAIAPTLESDAPAVVEAPKATRFGRPAKLMVFTLIGTSLLVTTLSGGWWLFFSRTQMPDALAVVMVALVGLCSLLTLVIGLMWVLIVADMVFAHRVAGRDTKIACGVVGVMCALQTAAYFGITAFSAR